MRRRFQQHLLQIEFRIPPPEAREELLDSVRVSHERSSPRSGALAWVRVVEELGRTVDALGRFDDVGAQHFAPLGLPDPHHREVRDRKDKRTPARASLRDSHYVLRGICEVPETRQREGTHVLDLILT